MKLTKAFVDKAEALRDKDRAFYRDGEIKGFALRVTSSGVKSFVVETLIGNKVRRMTIGRRNMRIVKAKSLITDNPVKRLSQARAWYKAVLSVRIVNSILNSMDPAIYKRLLMSQNEGCETFIQQ